ncbi:CHAT domain-containing protein [Paractinoplanes globisporus]|uniref:CHAT domain-containing protein n=1 Tax=Paractinoplanes globisporus TaxID=113565 RepID=A0ABW6WTE4_9ACTN|nr:CHAT domain-containing protein [Actinoplanes globisporus]
MTSERVLLTVTPRVLAMTLGSDDESRISIETSFEADSFDPRRPSADTRLNALEARGESLWMAAFSGSLGFYVEQAGARARERGAAVTLQFVASSELPAALHWLPWEVLFDPRRRDHLSLNAGWSVVRGVDAFQSIRPLSIDDLRVRVLVLDSSPEADAEAAAVGGLLGAHGDVEILRAGTSDELVSHLTGDVSLVHMIGDGRGDGLRLAEREGFVGGAEIADAIADNRGIGLVVFSGSTTASIAAEVEKIAGVTVLAHLESARAVHATEFAGRFYRDLMDLIPADVAVAEARRAVDRRFPGERAWASAVLLTGWPPLVLGRSSPGPGSGSDVPRQGGDLDAAELRNMLYTLNREKGHELLASAPWNLVRKQVEAAEDQLRDLPSPPLS